jgi:hypothetical protein
VDGTAARERDARRLVDKLGVADPEAEFSRWLEEEGMVGRG